MSYRQLEPQLVAIRERTRSHPDLAAAHHFTFALPHRNAHGRPEYVVLGVNPGEPAIDHRTAPGGGHEESFDRDFHREQNRRAKASTNWLNLVDYFTGESSAALTELFFWSSRDSKQFKQRFGPLKDSPHLEFCTSCNQALLTLLKPNAVLVPGLGIIDIAKQQYSLTKTGTSVRCDQTGHRLVEEYSDGNRPWIFMKHWSAAFGFSRNQREKIREFIRGQAVDPK